jgi:alpha-L-rhamnosidase
MIRHLLALVVLSMLPATAAPKPPVDLRCDGRVEPLAAGARPHLSWRIGSDTRGAKTAAWQVLVAGSREMLDAGKGDLWDSGKTAAGRMPGAFYAGKPLAAGDRCFWKARWWDAEDKVSDWSATATWETAPLKPGDWQGATWMNDGKANPTRDEDFYKDDPAPLMRREFEIAKPVVSARLHFAGLGLGYPSLNGERLEDHVFDPPWTQFDKRIHFRTHDVTDLVKEGRHCLGITLGNGWYNPLPLRMWGHRNIRGSIPTGRPRAIACLIVTHPDGSTTTITSGEDWKTAPGPTLHNSIYLGEKRDARKAIDGWNRAGFDDASWKTVAVVEEPLDVLQPLAMPPARLEKPIAAKQVTSPEEGVHIVDFGTNFTGLAEVRLEAPAGTRIEFRYGELLHEDGSLNPMTSVCGQIKGNRKDKDGNETRIGGPGSPEIAWQQNVYIARGGGPEIFRPDFTFQAFRYMEIKGLPQAPAPEDCRGLPMHTALAPAGRFESSNDLLGRIQEMILRTFVSNVVTVQSDCPHRERFGYGGDIVATSTAYLMNYDMHGFYAKTARDWADAARPDGRLTDTAPFVGIDYCGVGWAMAHPLLVEQLYQYYGDRRLLKEQTPVATRWIEGLAATREDGIVKSGLGDHEALTKGRGPEFSTPMFIDAARRVARLNDAIGEKGTAAKLRAMADESADAWSKAFLNPETGAVGEGGQPAQCFALGFGAAAGKDRDKVFEHLVADLTAPEDAPRLTTGIYGTMILLEELSKNGRSDLAFDLADRETFPSWGWMLKNGATTQWEDWKGTDNVKSHNHPMFGSVSAWMFRWLGGIQCADDAVGFDRIRIRPQLVGDLEWVRSSHDTVRGRIVSNWSVKGEQRIFEIVVPPDIEAEIVLPRREKDRITESGQPLDKAEGIEVVSDDGAFHVKAGSGSYRFEIGPRS